MIIIYEMGKCEGKEYEEGRIGRREGMLGRGWVRVGVSGVALFLGYKE